MNSFPYIPLVPLYLPPSTTFFSSLPNTEKQLKQMAVIQKRDLKNFKKKMLGKNRTQNTPTSSFSKPLFEKYTQTHLWSVL